MYKRPITISLFSLRVVPVLSLLVLLLLLTACGGDNGGGSSAGAPDAKTLISNAQTAIQKASAYHFNLQATSPGAGTQLFTIQGADGDIVTPDKLKATATALVGGISTAQVNVISIGADEYVTDPITGSWKKQSGLIDARTLTSSDTGISAILGHIQNPSTPTDSSVDGTPCWSTSGKLDTQYLKSIVGDAVVAGTVDVTACVGKSDNEPYLLKFTGAVIKGDTAQTVRTFKLSKFGESVTITAPI